MAKNATEKTPALNSDSLTEDLQQDLALFRALKPYLGHCLTMNHDLNNPLAGILGYAEFLQNDDNLTDDQRHSLSQIVTCAERMKALIEALCTDKLELAEKIDLASITESYVNIAKKLD